MKRYSAGVKKWIDVEVLNPDGQPTTRRRRIERAFVQVPLKRFARACKASNNLKAFVWAWLEYEVWHTKSTTVSVLTGALKQYGISRNVKRRALKDFERGGMLTIHKSSRRSVKVTVIGDVSGTTP
jgi:hypothetical protein